MNEPSNFCDGDCPRCMPPHTAQSPSPAVGAAQGTGNDGGKSRSLSRQETWQRWNAQGLSPAVSVCLCLPVFLALCRCLVVVLVHVLFACLLSPCFSVGLSLSLLKPVSSSRPRRLPSYPICLLRQHGALEHLLPLGWFLCFSSTCRASPARGHGEAWDFKTRGADGAAEEQGWCGADGEELDADVERRASVYAAWKLRKRGGKRRCMWLCVSVPADGVWCLMSGAQGWPHLVLQPLVAAWCF